LKYVSVILYKYCLLKEEDRMKKFLITSVVALTVCFAYTQISFAACGGGPTVFTCNTADPNPDPTGIQESGNNNPLTVNVLPGAGIDTVTGNGGNAIDLGDGGNAITVDNGSVIGAVDAVATGFGNDNIDIISSDLTANDDCIESSNGNDIVNFTDSTCSAIGNAGEGMELLGGNDTANVLRSEIICNPNNSGCQAVEAGSGDDNITVVESTLRANPNAITLGNDDDILNLGTGSNVEGLMDCGSGFDTLIFSMDVPEETLALISSEIAGLNPGLDSITINGLFYDWEDCELILNELNGVRNVRPIPTLSEWGLTAMAGVLGIIGLIAVRRRNVTA
jgi:IPTL-CTERM motif